MPDNDAAYYRMRAAKERMLAGITDKQEVAAIHRDMADRYSALAKKPVRMLKIVA